MELWIRSQDKKSLKRINTEIYLKKDLSDYAKGDVFFLVSGGGKLGEYDTEERALEVLDEIQCFLNGSITKELYVNGDYCGSWKTQRTEIVYEMPKE